MAARPPIRSRAGRALAAAALVAALGGPAAAAPVIGAASATCELGSVVQGEQPDCTFALANAGDADLIIELVEPACGCTTALLSASRLSAGESGLLRVVFDSDKYVGEIVKEIVVRSNDPVRPSLVLLVRAVVEPEIEFEPRAVSFEDVLPGGPPLLQTVMLTNRRAEPVRLLRLESRPEAYRCRVPAWEDPTRPLQLESWDRVGVEVRFAAPERLAMAVPGECAFELEGPRKRHFTLKLLALPARGAGSAR